MRLVHLGGTSTWRLGTTCVAAQVLDGVGVGSVLGDIRGERSGVASAGGIGKKKKNTDDNSVFGSASGRHVVGGGGGSGGIGGIVGMGWLGGTGWKPVSEELIKEGIELVLDVRSHPLLVMCSSGIHETGTFIGCLRKLQGWNFNSILVEYRFFAGSKSRFVNEQFIELFDLDLITLPAESRLPAWFVEAREMLREEMEGIQ